MTCKSITLLLSLPAILLASVVANAEDDAATESEAAENICFNSDRVQTFDGLSDNYLFIEINNKDQFLLTMRNRCFGLRNSQVIAFKNTMRRVCSNDNFTEILVSDMGRRTTCRVNGIERVESKEEAKTLVADREAAADDSDE